MRPESYRSEPASQPPPDTGSAAKKLALPLLALLGTAEFFGRPEMPELHSNEYDVARAREELARDGITSERRSAYVPGMSEAVYRSITPVNYQTAKDVLRTLPHNLLYGRKNTELFYDDMPVPISSERMPKRDDAWRFYLGLPQQHDTFRISDFIPPHEVMGYTYALNGWLESFLAMCGEYDFKNEPDGSAKKISKKPATLKQAIEQCTNEEWLAQREELRKLNEQYSGLRERDKVFNTKSKPDDVSETDWVTTHKQEGQDLQEELSFLVKEISRVTGLPGTNLPMGIACEAKGHMLVSDMDWDTKDGVMGTYHVFVVEDKRGSHLFYYDVWDLDKNFVEGETGTAGRPFTISDGVSFNPKTFKEIKPKARE